jgi:hypothetical protein
MPRRTQPKPALLVRVLTEIGRGRITETFIKDKHHFVHGETDGRHIRINPAIATCDTLIHETLHRLEPHWSESYVRRTTTFLLRRMSDEQVEQLFETYHQIAKRKAKRAKRGVRCVDPGNSSAPQQQEPRLCGRCRSVEQSAEVRIDGSARLEGRAGEVDG